MTCACGTEVADALLACPSCHRLVHADILKGLAAALTNVVFDGSGSLSTAPSAAWLPLFFTTRV